MANREINKYGNEMALQDILKDRMNKRLIIKVENEKLYKDEKEKRWWTAKRMNEILAATGKALKEINSVILEGQNK